MNIDRALLVAAAAMLPGLAACTPIDAGFGDSVRTNMAVQTVEPDPAYDGPWEEASGAKTAAAVERYRTDKVKQPKGIRTTTGITGGSGGSSGGSR